MDNVALVICGGLHPPQETNSILAIARQDPLLGQCPIVPLGQTDPLTCLSAQALRQEFDQGWGLRRSPGLSNAGSVLLNPNPKGASGPSREFPALILWAFSAGCVGTVALAHHWHRYRNQVLAIFLVDGWGVPWGGNFPCHRLSHDAFTHVTANGLGAGQVNFVAQPAVPHRHLWRHPGQVMGQQIMTSDGDDLTRRLPPTGATELSAADFLCGWSRRYLTDFRGLDDDWGGS